MSLAEQHKHPSALIPAWVSMTGGFTRLCPYFWVTGFLHIITLLCEPGSTCFLKRHSPVGTISTVVECILQLHLLPIFDTSVQHIVHNRETRCLYPPCFMKKILQNKPIIINIYITRSILRLRPKVLNVKVDRQGI